MMFSSETPTRTATSGTHQGVEAALAPMEAVDLAQLDQAQLHDRVESKVVLRTDDVAQALDALAAEYFVLEHAGERVQDYRNQYFDSVELRNYHEHHNQLGRRLKLRYRTYVGSNLTFFEVKRNVNGRTIKERRVSRPPSERLWDDDAEFFAAATGWDPAVLSPSLTVDYGRILLVKRDFSERVTIDLDLRFSSRGRRTAATGLSICEFKQPRLDLRSTAMVAMNRRPQMFSKYCMGLASCDPDLRQNRFKQVFLSLDALDLTPSPPTWPQPVGAPSNFVGRVA